MVNPVSYTHLFELHMIRHASGGRALSRDLELFLRQGHTEHVDTAGAVEIKRHPTPAAADVQHALAGFQVKLGGDMRLLVNLRLFQTVRRIGEVGAAILHVGIEEEPVEIIAEIIMMRDVALRS